MGLQTFERLILAETKAILKNPKLRLKDILEWSSSEKFVRGNLEKGDVMIQLPRGVWVAVAKASDHRR